jgi:phosphatidylinositol glycan class B
MKPFRSHPPALLALLAASVLLRLCPTVFWPSLDWGDEIYQALEPAHRLVFGTGLVTWEFLIGIRSWLLPGALAGILALAHLVGGGPGLYLPAVALCLALLSLIPVIGTYRWCETRLGVWPAWAGASVAAFAPELGYFGARSLAEVVAGHVLVGAMFLSRAPMDAESRPRWRIASGMMLGLAVALRPQILPAAIVMFAWPGMGARMRLVGGGATVLAASALLDWATLGSPGASIWRYAAVNLSGASASFGVQPWYYYGLAEAAVWGIALPIPIALCLWGARRWALPLAMALAILAVHMAIGHKEHRFLYPALVLCAVSAGIGLADLVARAGAVGEAVGRVRSAALVAGAAWAGLSAALWFAPGMSVLRHRVQNHLAAADYVAGLPGVCGIGMGPKRDAWVPYGGYTHLHQNVPLFWPADQAAFRREEAGFNILLSETNEMGFAPLQCFGAVCVSRRPGSCVAMAPDLMPASPARK